MLAEEYIIIDISLIPFIMVRLVFATSVEVYSASLFLFIFNTGLDVTQNISTAESRGRSFPDIFRPVGT
jgi:hypothetical protein